MTAAATRPDWRRGPKKAARARLKQRVWRRLYEAGWSCGQIGREFGVSDCSVHEALRRRGVRMRPRPTAAAIVTYRGDRYAPDASGNLRATSPAARGDPARLYLLRRVWIEHHGPIPAGHVVRPINGNKADARPENVACVSTAEVRATQRVSNGSMQGWTVAPYPAKSCPACGAAMTPHAYELPAQFIRRRTCGVACAAVLRRGAPRRGPQGRVEHWKQYARRLPRRKPPRLATAEQIRFLTADPKAHLGLVYAAAGRLAAKLRCGSDELLGDAYLAMVEAARTFRPEKGFRFSTHAVTALKFRLYKAAMEDRGRTRQTRGASTKFVDPLRMTYSSEAVYDDHRARGVARDDGPGDAASEDHRRRARVRSDLEDLFEIAREIGAEAERVMRVRARVATDAAAASLLGVSRTTVGNVVRRVTLRARGEAA